MFALPVIDFIAFASPKGVSSVIFLVISFNLPDVNALPLAIPITVFLVFEVRPSVMFCKLPPRPTSSLLVKSAVNPLAPDFSLSIPLFKSPSLSNLSILGILVKVSFFVSNFAESASIPVIFFTLPKSSNGSSIVFNAGTPEIAPPSLSPRPPMFGISRLGTTSAISDNSLALKTELNPACTSLPFPLASDFALPNASLIPDGLPDATIFKGDFGSSNLGVGKPVIEPSNDDNACGTSPPVFSALTVNPAESYPESALV